MSRNSATVHLKPEYEEDPTFLSDGPEFTTVIKNKVTGAYTVYDSELGKMIALEGFHVEEVTSDRVVEDNMHKAWGKVEAWDETEAPRFNIASDS